MNEEDSNTYPLHVRRYALILHQTSSITYNFIHHLSASRFALSVVTGVGYGKRVKSLQDGIVLENIEIDRCECLLCWK